MRTREMKAGINRTIKRLNSEIPKWRRLVDKDELDISSLNDCVTGHVYGDYYTGLHRLGISEKDAWYFGLNICNVDPYTPEYEENFDRLTQLWKEALS